jgi:hypothetical protein
MVKNIHLASFAKEWYGVAFKDPLDFRVYKFPFDRIPRFGAYEVVERELIAVDLKLRGSDDPVGGMIGRVDRVDFGGMGTVVKFKIKMNDAVATMDGR